MSHNDNESTFLSGPQMVALLLCVSFFFIIANRSACQKDSLKTGFCAALLCGDDNSS